MHSFSTKVWKNNQPLCCFLFPELTVMHGKALPALLSNHASSHFHTWFAYQYRRDRLAKTNIKLKMSASYEPFPFAAISRDLQYHLICSLHCQTIIESYFPMHLVTAGGHKVYIPQERYIYLYVYPQERIYKAIYNKWSLLSNNNTA